jgi:hypothetical protein
LNRLEQRVLLPQETQLSGGSRHNNPRNMREADKRELIKILSIMIGLLLAA